MTLLLQNQDASSQISRDKRYRGARDCLKRVIREQGFRSLWRGYLVTIFRYFNTNSFTFAMNSHYKKINIYDKDKDPFKFLTANLFAGAAAGMTNWLVFYPLDFARTRLAVDVGKNYADRQFKNIFDWYYKILKSDGFTGLYRGLGITLLLTILYRSTYFGLFDTGKAYLFTDPKKQNLFLLWMFGTWTTAFGNFMFYPLDTVRKRLQMQSGRVDKQYTTAIQCIQTIYRKEGPFGFYKGVVPNIFKAFGGSMVLVLNDKMKNLL